MNIEWRIIVVVLLSALLMGSCQPSVKTKKDAYAPGSRLRLTAAKKQFVQEVVEIIRSSSSTALCIPEEQLRDDIAKRIEQADER